MDLLNTHTLLWFFHDDPKLPERTKDILCSNVEVSISIATLWEIAIKKSIRTISISSGKISQNLNVPFSSGRSDRYRSLRDISR